MKKNAELTEINSRLLQARTKELGQALRARDEFISLASHELKTPLTSLKIRLQLVARTLKRNLELPVSEEFIESTIGPALKQIVERLSPQISS